MENIDPEAPVYVRMVEGTSCCRPVDASIVLSAAVGGLRTSFLRSVGCGCGPEGPFLTPDCLDDASELVGQRDSAVEHLLFAQLPRRVSAAELQVRWTASLKASIGAVAACLASTH